MPSSIEASPLRWAFFRSYYHYYHLRPLTFWLQYATTHVTTTDGRRMDDGWMTSPADYYHPWALMPWDYVVDMPAI